jgi:hypothetical protein
MTDEEWKKAEKAMSTTFGSLKMKIDGYDITVCRERGTPMKDVLAVYVNGYIKGEWLTQDCEIRRKFYYRTKKSLIKSKDKSEYIKKFGKRAFDKFVKANPDKIYYTYYLPYFGSFRTLKSHFTKNNQSIELTEIN